MIVFQICMLVRHESYAIGYSHLFLGDDHWPMKNWKWPIFTSLKQPQTHPCIFQLVSKYHIWPSEQAMIIAKFCTFVKAPVHCMQSKNENLKAVFQHDLQTKKFFFVFFEVVGAS